MTTIFQRAETDIETFLEGAWAALKPEIISLGDTVLAQCEQAVETYLTTGGNFAEAIGVVVSQLPADLTALESAVAGYMASLVSTAKANAAAANPATATPAAT
jgi:hypothetical protein